MHGAIATNKHVAHFDPMRGEYCQFCGEVETVEHLFLTCERLEGVLRIVQGWCSGLGRDFSRELYTCGPRYKYVKRRKVCLLNFLFGQAKLATWKSRKNKRLGKGSFEAGDIVLGLVAARLRVEFTYYKLVRNLSQFVSVWGINGMLCEVEEGNLKMNL